MSYRMNFWVDVDFLMGKNIIGFLGAEKLVRLDEYKALAAKSAHVNTIPQEAIDGVSDLIAYVNQQIANKKIELMNRSKFG